MISVDYNKNEPYILMADDDDDDSLFITAAFKEVGLMGAIKRVNNGEELIVQLKELIEKKESLPSLILLDLNMPKKNGKEALKIIKGDIRFKQIPVIVYSTSSTKSDIMESYSLGCNGFIVKPNDYHEIEKIAQKIKLFFTEITLANPENQPEFFL